MVSTNRDDDAPADQESALAELLVTYHQYLIDQSWQGSGAPPLPNATLDPGATNGDAETPHHSNPADSSLDDSLVVDPQLAEKLAELENCLWQLELHRRANAEPAANDASVAAAEGNKTPERSPVLFDLAGRRIGRFELLRELGRGGLGVVFLARDPVLKRLVALKIPRGDSLPGADARERFQREAQAAARLTHPHIVPVFEIGEVGPVSYIASAYVPGRSLAEWLREQTSPVPIRDAAQLVADLADAMQYAHAQGVLHRDLKPANVLLETPAIEAAFQVGDTATALSGKIADFGLAKLLDQVGHDTRSGVIVGTPAYMSPEQAEGLVNELGPATDIYSLGVILFELLAGEPPFRGKSDAATLARVVQGKTLSLRAARADVPRDLEAICLKCLEPKPGDRYASAGELADDLRRFCRGEATTVRPLTAGQRLARWTRRNPVVATLSALSLMLLLSIATISTVAALRIRTARDEAQQIAIAEREARERADRALLAEQAAVQQAKEAEAKATEAREQAEQQAKNATQISSLLEDLFMTADPMGMAKLGFRSADEVGMDLPLSELLSRGAEQARTNLADQPLVLATMLDTLGNVYSNLWQVKDAEPLIQDAYDLRVQHGASEADMATSQLHLGHLRLMQGRMQEGEPLLREAIEGRKRLFGDDSLLVADASLWLIWLLIADARANTEDVYARIEHVYNVRLAALGEDHRDVGLALMVLAISKYTQGDEAVAQQLLLRATQVFARQEGGEKLMLALNDVVQATFRRNRTPQDNLGALKLYRKAYPTLCNVMGKKHFLSVILLAEIGFTMFDLGETIEAEAVLRESVETAIEIIPGGSPLLVRPIHILAALALSRGDVVETERLHRRYFHANDATSRIDDFTMARMHIIAGRFDEAAKLIRDRFISFEDARTNSSSLHEFIAYVFCKAELAHCLGDVEETSSLYRRLGVETHKNGYARVHMTYVNRLLRPDVTHEHMLTDVSLPIEQWMSASPMLPGVPEDAWQRTILARCLMERGLLEEIDRPLAETLEFMRRYATPGSWSIGHTEVVMGELRAAQGKNEEAEQLLLSGLANLRKSRGEHHWLTRDAATALVNFYKNNGREAEAAPYEPLLVPVKLKEDL